MGKFKFPSAYTILFFLIAVVAVLTWIVPAGQYHMAMNEALGKDVPVAGTYAHVAAHPQGLVSVLMAPIALAAAKSMGVSPYPFAMVVAMAASAAFMTPVSSPVNTLVLGPGKYSFSDFVKIGVPFTIMVMVVCVLLIPVLFPF